MELSVKAYREEQLTKAYLSTEVVVEPVTDAMVQAYYDANLADFGARDFANYQMLRIDVGDNAELKNKALSILEAATAQADWQKLAAQAEQNGGVVQFLTGVSSEFSLLPDYKNVIDALAPQQVSAIQDGAGRIFRIRVFVRIQTPAKPLAEVAADIRKSLAPLQMKKAIQQASQQLKMHTEVEIYALPEEQWCVDGAHFFAADNLPGGVLLGTDEGPSQVPLALAVESASVGTTDTIYRQQLW